ncbi:hypothetical protein TNCV_2985961 [Trichonephila clavipes]|nr:hypothetical protein TNCV_2985961 [Trichonephila clavipes]
MQRQGYLQSCSPCCWKLRPTVHADTCCLANDPNSGPRGRDVAASHKTDIRGNKKRDLSKNTTLYDSSFMSALSDTIANGVVLSMTVFFMDEIRNVETKDCLDVGERRVRQHQNRFPNRLAYVMPLAGGKNSRSVLGNTMSYLDNFVPRTSILTNIVGERHTNERCCNRDQHILRHCKLYKQILSPSQVL